MFYNAAYIRTVVLPSTITSIGNYAFYGCTGFTSFVVPQNVTSIGNGAFGGCSNLRIISIPPATNSIGSNAFNSCNRLSIYSHMDSYATIFSIDNNIPLEFTSDAFADSDSLFLDRSKCAYVSRNVGKLSSSGTADYTMTFGFKSSAENSISEMKVLIRVPNGTSVVSRSIRDDKNAELNYSEKDGVLTIPVTDKTGTIRLSLRPTELTDMLSYAQMSFKKSGELKKEVIGIVREDLEIITIDTKEVTSESSITVSGLAPTSATVELSIDGIKKTSVSSNKAGNYISELTLPNVSDGNIYTITAAVQGVTTVAKTMVTYKENAPELQKLTMYYGNHQDGDETVLYPESNITPYVSFNPAYPFKFVAEIQNPETVTDVCITSTRNGVTKYIDAEYNKTTGKYEATGYFDEDNHSYVPGKIGVEYRPINEIPLVSDNVDFGEMLDKFTDEAKNAEVTIIENTNTSKVAEIDVTDVLHTAEKTAFKLAIKEYDSAYDTTLLSDTYGVLDEANGWISLVLNGENSKKYKSYSKSFGESWVNIISDISGRKTIAMMLESSDNNLNSARISDISLGLSYANFFAGGLQTYYKTQEIRKEQQELDERIMTTMPEHLIPEALAKSKELADDKVNFTLVAFALPLFVTAIGITGAPAILFTGILSMMTLTSSYFWSYRTANILGGTGNIKFSVDPSGYVYEGSEDHRIEGVTATAYWIEYDENDDKFWDAPDTSKAKLWNAAEYSQANPVRTDSDGKYAWDVPEGWWQVKYEKEGYETTYSEWLPVPPPQTEVNICMQRIGGPIEHFTLTYNASGGNGAPTAQIGNGPITLSNTRPTRNGYTFMGWATNASATVAKYEPGASFNLSSNMTLYAVWQKNDTPPAVQPTIKIKNFTATKSVDYKATVTFTAITTDVPEGATIQWFVNEKKAETGETCTVKQATADYTVQCKLIGSDGSVLAESEVETVKVNTGFFAKLVAFFKGLFGSLPIITQAIKETL